MSQIMLYPLRFEPIYEYRPWGGRRLAELFGAVLPGDEPIGEAWLLSDREDMASHVAEGPLKGLTLGEVLQQSPEQLLGKQAGQLQRFPLLLKFLDASGLLSVQVHPSNQQTDFLPVGEQGKNEAWLVLEAGSQGCIYAGLYPGATAETLRRALADKTLVEQMPKFKPRAGEVVFIPAGTVHAFSDLVVFEVQQNSDVTFRLYDWDRVEAKTGQARELQVEQALACTNFTQGLIGPKLPLVQALTPVRRERLIQCEQFVLWRHHGEASFTVGAADTPRVLVCIRGEGQLEYQSSSYAVAKGEVLLLPAVVGECLYRPNGSVVLLEVGLP